MPAEASAPTQLDVAALERVGGPIAAGLLPGWRTEWRVLTQAQLDTLDERLPGPNLAIVETFPKRRMATVNIVTPWPASESLSETLHHEIGHAWIAPITAQIPQTEASVILEEQLVETLGVYLASLGANERASARRALAPIVEKYAPRLRARIAARAGTRARGGQMDPEKLKKLIEAIKNQDGPAALLIAEELLVEAASNGAAPSAATTAAPMDGQPAAAAGAVPPEGDPAAMDTARPAARKGAIVESDDIRRARVAREQIEQQAADTKVATEILRNGAKEQLVATVRARLPGHAGLPALEKRIMAAPDASSAKLVADIGIEMAGGEGATRARSGVEHAASPDTSGGAPAVTSAALIAEGFPSALAQELAEMSRKTPELAQHSLRHARARLHGGDNQYMPADKGARKAS